MLPAPPCVQLHAGDHLRRTSGLTLAARGAYSELEIVVWDRGVIPDDEALLCRLARCDASEWASIRGEVVGALDRVDGGFTIAHIRDQRQRQSEITEKRSKAGKLGATERWQTPNKRNGKSVATGITSGMANPYPPNSEIRDPDPKPDPGSTADRECLSRAGLTVHVATASAPVKPLINGRAVRHHSTNHAWCDWARGMCVPHTLHEDLQRRLQKTDADLRAWYPTVIASQSGESLPSDVFRFWNAEADRWTGARVQTVSGRPQTRNEASIAAAKRIIDDLERPEEAVYGVARH